jgi:large exoprotein involved in heme utilization and adhesion
LQLLGTTTISASTFASGNGGNINVNVTGAAIINGEGTEENAEIASKTSGAGNGGNVTVTAGDLQVINGGNIGTDTSGSGASGNVVINANSLEMTAPSIISADTFSTGVGGNVTLNVAGPITMAGKFTAIGAETGQSTAGAGNGGSVVVNAASIQINGQAEIDTSTIGPGNAGALTVNVGSIAISGAGAPANTTGLFADAASLTPSVAGNGGDITIRGSQMSIFDGGQVSTRSSDAGNGGDISINLDTLDMNGGDIESAAGGAGNAGNVAINIAGAFTMENSGLVLATSVQSHGGQIQANVGSLAMDFSGMTSQTLGTQPGGDISINAAGNIQLTNGSVISAIAFDSDAGSITLIAGANVALTRSGLTTSAEGAGGNITIDPTYVILGDSFVVAEAINKNGGNILITPDVLLVSTDSIITASSAKGVSGEVEETSPDQDLAGQLVTLPGSLYSVEATLQDICAVKLGGDFSSFITAPNGGLPLEPGGWMPSFTPGSNAIPQTAP